MVGTTTTKMRRNSAAIPMAILLGGLTQAIYREGVIPQSFGEGDQIRLTVNKMTSSETLMPIEYYRLPFCQPDGGPKMESEILGELLAGDRIESSPYRLQMKKEMYCEQLCSTDLGRAEEEAASPNKMVRAIRKNYHNNWIVDNLSAASRAEDDKTITIRYSQGFPVGYINPDTHKAYIHNHVNIEIMYHAVETETNKFQIVRFTIQPFSIKHSITISEDKVDGNLSEERNTAKSGKALLPVDIKNPIASCDPSIKDRTHTSYDMIQGSEPQLASGKVLWTYDVLWIENKPLHWASRWDIYLDMDDSGFSKIHWLSITSSLVIVFVLSAIVAAISVRNLRRDYARCNRLATDEESAESLEEFGWKSVHADVFRPPSFSPMLLAVACGTGAQLLCMSVLTIIFSAMGFLSPANRGSLLTALLLLYVLMGGVSGYTGARLYKTFKGESWMRATTLTAFGFPGIAFTVFFIMDFMASAQGSSNAVPFTTIIILLVLWFGISTPLVFLGAYFGYRQEAISFPVNTSNIPRQIPDQPWFVGIPFALAVGGILPFGACYVELYCILSSVWMGKYYYVFGILFLVFLILIVTCAEITVLFCYCQLCRENYRWWWRSFCTAGSTSLYVFGYSFVYFKQLHASGFATYLLYFGYMALASFALLLMTGFVGVMSSLWFNKTIFSLIKTD